MNNFLSVNLTWIWVKKNTFFNGPFTPLYEKFVFNTIAATLHGTSSVIYHVLHDIGSMYTSYTVLVGVFSFFVVTLFSRWPTYVSKVYTLEDGSYIINLLPIVMIWA